MMPPTKAAASTTASGLLLVKEVLYSELVSKIQLFVCAAHKVVVAALL